MRYKYIAKKRKVEEIKKKDTDIIELGYEPKINGYDIAAVGVFVTEVCSGVRLCTSVDNIASCCTVWCCAVLCCVLCCVVFCCVVLCCVVLCYVVLCCVVLCCVVLCCVVLCCVVLCCVVLCCVVLCCVVLCCVVLCCVVLCCVVLCCVVLCCAVLCCAVLTAVGFPPCFEASESRYYGEQHNLPLVSFCATRHMQ